MIGFPQDPDDGEIFQVNDDLAYQYDENKKCWVRLSGLTNVKLADKNNPGLMSKEDFIKIENILLPSFDTTITGELCDDIRFQNGRVDLVSTKGDVEIDAALKVYNPDGVIEEKDFVIHNNTVGIDFRINMPRLLEELENRGTLTYKAPKGDKGDRGDRGEPGEDRVDVGPVGEKGQDGANAPFVGSLTEDLNEAVPTNKAVVDIKNDEENPEKIIVTIGNIGNPGIGPSRVSWKNKQSNWVAGLSTFPLDCNVPPECTSLGNVIYLDVTPILDKIQDKFGDALDEIKKQKEKVARDFIDRIASVFSEQRQAVCCALESSVSKKINQNIRNIMSNGRYQAAQAGYAFRVDSNKNDEYERKPKRDPNHVPNPASYLPDFQEPGDPNFNVVINGNLDQNVIQFNCDDCFVQVLLDNTNLGPNRSVVVDLPAGVYVATIIDCCMYYNGTGGTGVFTLTHNNGSEVKKIRNKGMFPEIEDRNEYIGESIAFNHSGGKVELYGEVLPSFGVGNGITICIQPSHCFQRGECADLMPITCDPEFFVVGKYPGKSVTHELGNDDTSVAVIYDFFNKTSRIDVYHPASKKPENLVATSDNVVGSGSVIFSYEDVANKGNQVLVDITSLEEGAEFTYALGCETTNIGDGSIFSTIRTSVKASHAAWYERGWRANTGCGAHIRVGDQEFIVIYKSIGTDCSCGGGEYEDTPFIRALLDANFGSQPAIAWPTIDGKTFFGLPDDPNEEIVMEFDKLVSDEIVERIKKGEIISSIGDPTVFKTVVLPAF